jgi:hypothetical protein
MTEPLELSLQVFDAAALELLWNLLDVPVTSPTAATTTEMAAAVAEARAKITAIRQTRRVETIAAADGPLKRDERQRDARPPRSPRAAGYHRRNNGEVK